MKQLYCKLALAIIWLVALTTQIQAQEVDNTYAARMNYIFQHLDKSKVPFGLLKDAALEMAELNYYKGTVLQDSNRVFDQNWYEIYLTLATSQIHLNASENLPNPNKVDSIWFAKRKPGQITLAGLYYKYSRFIDNGVNKVTILNDQISDKYINGVWQNPYTVESVMAFAPATIEYDALDLQFLLPTELWLSNQKAQVNAIQVDAGDGLGFRTLQPGIPLPVQYYTNGLKTLKFKIIRNDNTILQSHSLIDIQSPVSITYAPNANNQGDLTKSQGIPEESAFGAEPETNFAPPPADLILGWSLISQSYKQDIYYVNSTETFNGIKAKGYITIQYANADKKIRKPLIVAEGFDTGMLNKPETYFGDRGINFFIQNLQSSTDLNDIIINFPQYDIIYIDWKEGTADLRQNVLLLKTVIRKVNEIKIADGLNPIEKNVVLGQSMGGVIARYALKKMEVAGENHDTRLYISHDAPHQGANVPLGFQSMAVHAQNFSIKTMLGVIIISVIAGRQANLLLLNYSPAAEQLMINHMDWDYTINNSVHNEWQTELNALGYPQNCKNVAISNGSECGTAYPILPAGNLFLFDGYYKTKFWGDLLSMVALPVTGMLLQQGKMALLGVIPGSNKFNFNFEANSIADGGGNAVYKGKIIYKKKLFWLIQVSTTLTNKTYNAPSGLFPSDQFPGGYFLLGATEKTSTADENLYTGSYSLSIKPGFSFVSTPSALDIGQGLTPLIHSDYYTSYIGATPPPAPKNTPFDNFITAFSSGGGSNEEHISFTQRNGNWLAKELKNEPSLASCAVFCSPIISGTACLQSAGTYSVPNVEGATVQWQASGMAFIPGSANTNQITLVANGTGKAIIKAQISSDCGSFNIEKEIFVGSNQPQIILTGKDYNGTNTHYFKITNPVPDYTYKWYLNNNLIGTSGLNSDTFQWQIPCYPFNSIYAVIQNNCGYQSNSNTLNLGNPCNGYVVAYPNPASNILNISFTEEKILEFKHLDNVIPEFKVKLYDENSKLLLSGSSKKGQQEIILDTRNLPNGIYYLHIQQGNELIKKQVIIQHE